METDTISKIKGVSSCLFDSNGDTDMRKDTFTLIFTVILLLTGDILVKPK